MTVDDIFKSYGIKPIPEDVSEAMAYIPYQSNDPKIYSMHHGFEAGTIFPSLHKPFLCKECMEDEAND